MVIKSDNTADIFKVPKWYTIILCSMTMLMHLIYLIFFFYTGVTFMGIFNIFSVMFYTLGIVYLARGGNAVKLLCAALIEIVLHAIFATLFVGWEFGFQMFLICMIPVPYLISLDTKTIMHFISGFIIALFVTLRISSVSLGFRIGEGIESVSSDVWYIVNSIMSFLIILQVTLNFRIKMQRLTLSISQRNAQLQQAASVDSLTGLLNRRAMGEFIRQMGTDVGIYSAALMDIDFFKKVNDTYGHAMGDRVLVEISQILVSKVPSEGYVCRWGGEEILIIMPDTDLSAAVELIDGIRRDIASNKFHVDDETFVVTATFGVSEGCGESVEEVINRADECLYVGKASGRNCVIADEQG